jgi:hypothetical protein
VPFRSGPNRSSHGGGRGWSARRKILLKCNHGSEDPQTARLGGGKFLNGTSEPKVRALHLTAIKGCHQVGTKAACLRRGLGSGARCLTLQPIKEDVS